MEEERPIVVDTAAAEDDVFAAPVPEAIYCYGASIPAAQLVERMRRGEIVVPELRRKAGWSRPKRSRFIESLLLEIGSPEVSLFTESGTRRLLVVDGQQRLHTLRAYYDGALDGRPFELTGVDPEFDGKTYETLLAPYRTQLDDAIVRATIFEQDVAGADRAAMYLVFERLNSGGTWLRPQEIRACVYAGPFADLLRALAEDPHWRRLYGPRDAHQRDEEIVLRFLALDEDLDGYRPPMKRFLNRFMETHHALSPERSGDMTKSFRSVVRVADEVLGCEALRIDGTLNLAVLDAVFTGLARRLRRGPVSDRGALRRAHEGFMRILRERALHTERTTDPPRVRERLRLAERAYAAVP